MGHDVIRKWILEVLQQRPDVVAIPLRQRAKFEGWLKFELAAHAEQNGAQDVEVEVSSADSAGRQPRIDLALSLNHVRYNIQLKTPNTNWRLPGVENKTRPITKNIAGIVTDARNLSACPGHNLVAFVLFPLPAGDRRWLEYLQRISDELGTPLPSASHTTQVTLPLSSGLVADVVVCCFPVAQSGNLDATHAPPNPV